MKIGVVGCGFVGSVYTTEFLKRAFAGKLPTSFRFIDPDTVEARNCANQNFVLADIGRAKAAVMQELAVNTDRVAEVVQARLDATNMAELLDDCDLVIDGVDNLATRQLLWAYAQTKGTPVLHLGISMQGTGKVEWSHPDHTTFSLRPDQLVGKPTPVDPPSGVQPPCELVRMRGVGLQTGFAAAVAAGIYLGFDPDAHLERSDTRGWCTDWHTTPASFFPLKETWKQVTR